MICLGRSHLSSGRKQIEFYRILRMTLRPRWGPFATLAVLLLDILGDKNKCTETNLILIKKVDRRIVLNPRCSVDEETMGRWWIKLGGRSDIVI